MAVSLLNARMMGKQTSVICVAKPSVFDNFMGASVTKDIFARRTFEIDGQEVECRFFRPEEDEGNYFCRYEIDFPNSRRVSKAGGVDEVQAVLLAMQMAHTDLLAARENDGRQVAWLNDRSLGLPVNDGIRDWARDDRF